MNKRIENEKLIYSDCDDTLIMWDVSKYHGILPPEDLIEIDCFGYVSTVYKNTKQINLIKKLAKLGYGICIWSQTGSAWAEAVGKAVGIDEFVLLYTTKPRYHIDDLPADVWMGTRLWRDPVTGKESFNE
jgi:hypothetical protein